MVYEPECRQVEAARVCKLFERDVKRERERDAQIFVDIPLMLKKHNFAIEVFPLNKKCY